MQTLRLVFSTVLLLLFHSAMATEQEKDLLIYGNDTIFIDVFPLELLAEQDSLIFFQLESRVNCVTTSCYRYHIAIWKIENDSLFLIGLEDCCDGSTIDLSEIFPPKEIQNNKVFAHWFSAKFNAGFGKWLFFDEEQWKNHYEKVMDMELKNGLIQSIDIHQNILKD